MIDSKKPNETRATLVGFPRTRMRPLEWVGPLPVDLEALAAVPGRRNEFVALTSSGKGARIALHGNKIQVLREFIVPAVGAGDNYEGFALSTFGHRTVAVWADRGQDDRPGRLVAAEVDVERMAFGPTTSLTVRAEYPTTNVRHVSDIAVTAFGEILASSASDPGDEGPFDSSVYRAARISIKNGTVTLQPIDRRREIAHHRGHKIEAMTCLTRLCTHRLLGTDDESAGGAIRLD